MEKILFRVEAFKEGDYVDGRDIYARNRKEAEQKFIEIMAEAGIQRTDYDQIN